ncbi:MAG: hypothetical protein Q4E47_03730 [Candidatus Saccharibacteria bacterium]|nr:hypothetical protein [Candidatus Saccharibacteria bacterium]
MNITIFGAGAYGAALGQILTDNGHNIRYYDPAKYPDTNLSEAMDGAEMHILATPSAATPKLLFFIPKDKPLVCASKGLVSFAPFAGYEHLSAIGGGAFADDLMNKKPTKLTTSSQETADLFKTDWLDFDITTDTFGIMLCGTLKNIYSIGAGLWALEYGTQDYDDFINKSVAEMQIFLANNGCDPATAGLSCGIGDLVLTSRSKTSRNYAFGAKLRQVPTLGADVLAGTARINSTVEGLNAIDAIRHNPSFVRPATGVSNFDYIYAAVTNTPVPDLPV